MSTAKTGGSSPGAASSLGCAHQASSCSIAASVPDRLRTAGLYIRAACNCPDRARGGLGAAGGRVDAGCGEPPADWNRVLCKACT